MSDSSRRRSSEARSSSAVFPSSFSSTVPVSNAAAAAAATSAASGDDNDEAGEFPPPAAEAERPRAVWRTVTAAVLFFVTGSLMLYYGVLDVRAAAAGGAGADPQARERGLAMLVVGALTFLPGSYAVAVLVGARLGWPGYSFDSLPSYDEE